MLAYALVLLALPDPPGFQVDAEPACPDPGEVVRRLAALNPALPAGDRAHIKSGAGSLQIELSRSGQPLGVRRLAAQGSCDDLAEAAAVVIAAWESQLSTSGALPLPTLDHPAAAKPAVITVAQPAQPAQPRGVAAELWLGFAGSVAAAGFAPGATADVTLARRGSPWAGSLAVYGADLRDQPLGAGHVSWTRVTGALGPRYRLARRNICLDLTPQLLGALVWIDGQGYENNRNDSGFDIGIGAAARLAWARAKLAPWIGVALSGWLREQTIRVAGLAGSTDLPQLEVLGMAGVALGVPR
jgi:hypothetical protein